MSFIRPEAQRFFLRWRELLLGLGIALLGLYWASGFGVLKWVGVAVTLGGALLAFTGLQRARFRAGQDGPGVVSVDEGRITYYGPLSGGAIDLGEMTLLSLDPVSSPPLWVLHQPGAAELMIPITAAGADTLFDAFATLPGLRTEYMLTQLKAGADHPVVIWQKQAPRLH
jgi:hypothetical protein